jgi:hypothetical protein
MTFGRSIHTKLIAGTALALAAACGRSDEPRLDEGLRSDLSLATQAQQYRGQQFVSPQELGGQPQPYGQPGQYPNGYAPAQAGYAPYGPYMAPAPQPQVVERVVYRDRPAARRSSGRSSGSSRGTYSSAGTVYSEPRTRIKKNTKRDAAIGAAAGAAIGVATSARKDRLKGGLIGAVVGATAGAIIGNNVDKQRVPY